MYRVTCYEDEHLGLDYRRETAARDCETPDAAIATAMRHVMPTMGSAHITKPDHAGVFLCRPTDASRWTEAQLIDRLHGWPFRPR